MKDLCVQQQHATELRNKSIKTDRSTTLGFELRNLADTANYNKKLSEYVHISALRCDTSITTTIVLTNRTPTGHEASALHFLPHLKNTF